MTTETEVRERPILFSGPMVRAILDGRKTQTRRIMKPQPPAVEGRTGADFLIASATWMARPEEFHICGAVGVACELAGLPNGYHWECPYGLPGDRLWVRESFSTWHCGCHWYGCTPKGRSRVSLSNLFFRATHNFPDDDQKWVPGIFMPRWASRITLEITEIRVQRLQDISEDDAEAEGADKRFLIAVKVGNQGRDERMPLSHRCGFRELWNESNVDRGYSWESNPWVWEISFRKIEASDAEAKRREMPGRDR